MDTAKTPRATAGIICEFNPFHNGHAYLLRRAREFGDCVICLMSGRTVQRGMVAIADPYVRAEMALAGGADLVLELPFPWCSGSAAYFADAGVRILTEFGVEHLLFGSECGDLVALKQAADTVGSDTFVRRYTELCQSGEGTAAAYRTALNELLPNHTFGANDLLGISYLEAIARQNSPLVPITVSRLGNGYHETKLNPDAYPSATALRARMETATDTDALEKALAGTMPSPCLARLLSAVSCGEAPACDNRLPDIAHAAMRLATPEELCHIAELSGGLGDRMLKQARATTDGASFFESLKTKLYPDARLCRGMLFALTRVHPEDLSAHPTYTTVLAANGMGCAHLSTLRKEDSAMAIVTKPADAPTGRQKELSDRVDALVSLCLPTPRHAGWLMQKSPCIKKTD